MVSQGPDEESLDPATDSDMAAYLKENHQSDGILRIFKYDKQKGPTYHHATGWRLQTSLQRLPSPDLWTLPSSSSNTIMISPNSRERAWSVSSQDGTETD